MPNPNPNLRNNLSLFGWFLLAFLLVLNVWVDFRRPGWLIVDVVLVLALGFALIKNLRK